VGESEVRGRDLDVLPRCKFTGLQAAEDGDADADEGKGAGIASRRIEIRFVWDHSVLDAVAQQTASARRRG
jgi:hypothetical protein